VKRRCNAKQDNTNTIAYPVERAIKTTSFAALKEAASYELKVFVSTFS
jgi:hypothetical protein